MQGPRVAILTLSLTATAAAQNYLHLPAGATPQTQELNRWNAVPLMRPAARIQTFYDATECGQPSFIAQAAALRFDGTIPSAGGVGPYRIQRLRVRLGTTTVANPTAAFATNLDQPLTTVFDGTLDYQVPSTITPVMSWGGPGGSFEFAFATPVVAQIPPGGWLVLELLVEGNSNLSLAHAFLDAAFGSGGPAQGGATSQDAGCAAGPGLPAATAQSAGLYAPGGAWSVSGTNLGPNAPALIVTGARDDRIFGSVPLPFTVAGTSCALLCSWDLLSPVLTDASGNVPAQAPGTWLLPPPDPALSSVRLHHQILSVVPSANPTGVVLTDRRVIDLGTWSGPTPGVLYVADELRADTQAASAVKPMAFALRLRIL